MPLLTTVSSFSVLALAIVCWESYGVLPLQDTGETTDDVAHLKHSVIKRSKRSLTAQPTAGRAWNTSQPIDYEILDPSGFTEEEIDKIHANILKWQENSCLSFRYVISLRESNVRNGMAISRFAFAVEPDMIYLQTIFPEFITIDEPEDTLEGVGLALGLMKRPAGLPSDYGSVFYNQPVPRQSYYQFPWNDQLIDPYRRTSGKHDSPTFYDKLKLNLAYCNVTYPNQNCTTGYANPNNLSQCICPSGWEGERCDVVEASRGVPCGGEYATSNDWLEFSSPLNYSAGQACNWLFKADRDHVVHFKLLAPYDLEMDKNSKCRQYLELKIEDMANTGIRLCGPNDIIPEHGIVSLVPRMLVLFRSFVDFPTSGFRAAVRQIPICAHGKLDINATNQCVCHKGFMGHLCDQLDTDPNCGGKVELADTPHTLMVSDQTSKCAWIFKARKDKSFELKVKADEHNVEEVFKTSLGLVEITRNNHTISASKLEPIESAHLIASRSELVVISHGKFEAVVKLA